MNVVAATASTRPHESLCATQANIAPHAFFEAPFHARLPANHPAMLSPWERLEKAGRFVDDATGSRWNLLGEAVEGELAGATLAAVPRDDTFWFVWFAFRPETRVVR